MNPADGPVHVGFKASESLAPLKGSFQQELDVADERALLGKVVGFLFHQPAAELVFITAPGDLIATGPLLELRLVGLARPSGNAHARGVENRPGGSRVFLRIGR